VIAVMRKDVVAATSDSNHPLLSIDLNRLLLTSSSPAELEETASALKGRLHLPSFKHEKSSKRDFLFFIPFSHGTLFYMVSTLIVGPAAN
jgi:hypothetical protein